MKRQRQTGLICSRDLSKNKQKYSQATVKCQESSRTVSRVTALSHPEHCANVTSRQSEETQIIYQRQVHIRKQEKFQRTINRQHSTHKQQSISLDQSSQNSLRLPLIKIDENLQQKWSQESAFEPSVLDDSQFSDSLAIYENPLARNNEIVKKLGFINNIFKEIKSLKAEKMKPNIHADLQEIQNELIQVERQLLRAC